MKVLSAFALTPAAIISEAQVWRASRNVSTLSPRLRQYLDRQPTRHA